MDIIKVKNTSYGKYEEVLLRRDNLRKEAEHFHMEYIRVFGDLITRSFEMKIGCIRKKKMIAYCQRQINMGKKIDAAHLNNYIEQEMAEYQKELADMISDVKAVRDSKKISEGDYSKIKKIYYKLVRMIHPDLHPELEEVLGYIPEKDNLVFSRLMDAGKLLIGKVSDIQVHGTFHKIRIGIYLVDY